MSAIRVCVPVALSPLFTSCGTFAPDFLAALWSERTERAGERLRHQLFRDVINAVVDLCDQAKKYPDVRPSPTGCGGVQVA